MCQEWHEENSTMTANALASTSGKKESFYGLLLQYTTICKVMPQIVYLMPHIVYIRLTGYNQSVTGCGFQQRHVVVTKRI